MRFAKPSSISAVLLVGLAAGVVTGVVGLALDHRGLLAVGLALATLFGGGLALHVIASERRRHERAEAERARLSEQLVTAEQEERRRLAVFLHDTAVQSLSGVALMLDAAVHSLAAGKTEEASAVIGSALERHRATIRSLRDLSFNLEPVVLRDQGFSPAVRALADQLGLDQQIQIDLEVDAVATLSQQAQAGLYQIVREALHGAVRRGPPTRISVLIEEADDGRVETVIADDAPGERRRATFEVIEERVRTLNGRLAVEGGDNGGTVVRVSLPPYAARG